jgi:hypothetical protein
LHATTQTRTTLRKTWFSGYGEEQRRGTAAVSDDTAVDGLQCSVSDDNSLRQQLLIGVQPLALPCLGKIPKKKKSACFFSEIPRKKRALGTDLCGGDLDAWLSSRWGGSWTHRADLTLLGLQLTK